MFKLVAPDWFSQNKKLFIEHFKQYKNVDGMLYVEVGVWEGRSAIWMVENILTGKNCVAHFVDFWQPYDELDAKERELHSKAEENFDYNIATVIRKNKSDLIFHKHKMKSADALRVLNENCADMVYIDGSHDAKDVLEDMVYSWRVLKVNGTMIVDDIEYGKFRGTNRYPRLAVEAFLSCHKDDCVVLHKGAQLVVKKCS